MNCVRRREGARKIWGVLRGEAILKVHVTFFLEWSISSPIRKKNNSATEKKVSSRVYKIYRGGSKKKHEKNDIVLTTEQ